MKYLLEKLKQYDPEYNDIANILVFNKEVPVNMLNKIRKQIKDYNIYLTDMWIFSKK